MKRFLLIAGAVLVLGAIVVLSIRQGGEVEGEEVYAEAASRRAITQLVKARGEIQPRDRVNISAHVVAKIERIHVEEGNWIEAGRPFLELEKEAFLAIRDHWAAQRQMAETDIRQAEIALADAELKRKRYQRLWDDGVVAEEQLESAQLVQDNAELRLRQAHQAAEQARANLVKAEDDLAKTTIYAPLSGRVISLSAEEGEVVVSGTMNNPASVIGRIADLSVLLAEVDVDETEIAEVAVGQRASLEVDALPERAFEGAVVEVGSSGFSRPSQPDVTFFKVKIQLDQPDPALLPGMSVRAEIRTAAHSEALVVPIQSVVERRPRAAEDGDAPGEAAAEEVKVVFLVEDGEAVQRAVATGISDATHVEILSGLTEGEQVVTGPYRSLRDLEHGDPVEVKEEKEDKDSEGAS